MTAHNSVKPAAVKPAAKPAGTQVIEVSGNELKMILARLLAVAMTDRISQLRIRTDGEQVAFQFNTDLWSPAIGKGVP